MTLNVAWHAFDCVSWVSRTLAVPVLLAVFCIWARRQRHELLFAGLSVTHTFRDGVNFTSSLPELLPVADWSVLRFCALQSVSLARGDFRRKTHLI